MNLIEKNLVVNVDSKNDPKKKRVLVLGLGSTGISMVRWFMLKNAEIFVMDSRHRPPFQNLLREKFPNISYCFGIPSCLRKGGGQV